MRIWLLILGIIAVGFPAGAEDRNRVATDFLDICLDAISSEDLTETFLHEHGWITVTPETETAVDWWDGEGRPTVEQMAMIANFAVESLGAADADEADADEVATRLQYFMTLKQFSSHIRPLADHKDAVTFLNEEDQRLFSVSGLDGFGRRRCYYVGFTAEPDESLLARYGQEARIRGSLARGAVRLRFQPETNSDSLAGVAFLASADRLEHGLNFSLGHLTMLQLRQ